MMTIYIPDPEETLGPFDEERAVAEAAGGEFILGNAAQPQIRDAEIILTAGMHFPPEVIRTLQRCWLIVRYGIGVDTIDLATATECGIVVANAPTYCVAEVADHSAALILSFARRIPQLDRQIRAQGWSDAQKKPWGVRRLSELKLGIVGLGKIGRRVTQHMSPFGFHLLGYDPNLSKEQLRSYGVVPMPLDELLSQADIVSLHIPLMPQTHHIINKRRLALMKPSATIVNTSRGSVIDEAALISALQTDRLFGAALDVLEQEPPAADNPLLRIDPQRVILTPHFAASSVEVLPDLHHEVSEAFGAVLAGRWPPSTMNPDVVSKIALSHAAE